MGQPQISMTESGPKNLKPGAEASILALSENPHFIIFPFRDCGTPESLLISCQQLGPERIEAGKSNNLRGKYLTEPLFKRAARQHGHHFVTLIKGSPKITGSIFSGFKNP
jgi:hypothetical protein